MVLYTEHGAGVSFEEHRLCRCQLLETPPNVRHDRQAFGGRGGK